MSGVCGNEYFSDGGWGEVGGAGVGGEAGWVLEVEESKD